jgi:hypothetical protein
MIAHIKIILSMTRKLPNTFVNEKLINILKVWNVELSSHH